MGKLEQAPEDHKEEAGLQHIPMAEWVAAGVGLILVIAAIASLLHHAMTKDASPPGIRVSILQIEPQESGYLVRIRAENTGQTTAAQLVIEGVVKPAGGGEERRQLTLDYLPGGSRRTGALIFKSDPRTVEFEIRPVGYQDP